VPLKRLGETICVNVSTQVVAKTWCFLDIYFLDAPCSLQFAPTNLPPCSVKGRSGLRVAGYPRISSTVRSINTPAFALRKEEAQRIDAALGVEVMGKFEEERQPAGRFVWNTPQYHRSQDGAAIGGGSWGT
jgi:hypothetical protein